jgi:hypothetical protein
MLQEVKMDRFKIVLFTVFSLIFLNSCNKLFSIFEEKDLLERPKAERCSDCHSLIYQQWKKSRHSKSWISEHFKKSSENYSKVKCLSCHAPYEIKVLEKPELRDFHREDGINCVSCHFKDKTKSMHGPYDVFSPPHPSTQDKNYTKSKICSGCHQETYKQWKKAKSEKTCQSCHMPHKKEKLIQKFPFDLFHSKKEVYDHSTPALISKKEDFEIRLKKEEDNFYVYIKNVGVPHNLPTADQGKPKFYVDVIFYKDGKKVSQDSQTISFKDRDALVFNTEKEISFFTFEEFNRVKLVISRKLSWEEFPEKILEMEKSF